MTRFHFCSSPKYSHASQATQQVKTVPKDRAARNRQTSKILNTKKPYMLPSGASASAQSSACQADNESSTPCLSEFTCQYSHQHNYAVARLGVHDVNSGECLDLTFLPETSRQSCETFRENSVHFLIFRSRGTELTIGTTFANTRCVHMPGQFDKPLYSIDCEGGDKRIGEVFRVSRVTGNSRTGVVSFLKLLQKQLQSRPEITSTQTTVSIQNRKQR